MHCLRVVIFLFSTSLYKSAFSAYYFGRLGCFLSAFWFLCFCVFDFQLLFFDLCFEFNVILNNDDVDDDDDDELFLWYG